MSVPTAAAAAGGEGGPFALPSFTAADFIHALVDLLERDAAEHPERDRRVYICSKCLRRTARYREDCNVGQGPWGMNVLLSSVFSQLAEPDSEHPVEPEHLVEPEQPVERPPSRCELLAVQDEEDDIEDDFEEEEDGYTNVTLSETDDIDGGDSRPDSTAFTGTSCASSPDSDHPTPCTPRIALVPATPPSSPEASTSQEDGSVTGDVFSPTVVAPVPAPAVRVAARLVHVAAEPADAALVPSPPPTHSASTTNSSTEAPPAYASGSYIPLSSTPTPHNINPYPGPFSASWDPLVPWIAPEGSSANMWHVVIVGTRVGVFDSRAEVTIATSGVSGNVTKGNFRSYGEALLVFETALSAGTVRVVCQPKAVGV